MAGFRFFTLIYTLKHRVYGREFKTSEIIITR